MVTTITHETDLEAEWASVASLSRSVSEVLVDFKYIYIKMITSCIKIEINKDLGTVVIVFFFCKTKCYLNCLSLLCSNKKIYRFCKFMNLANLVGKFFPLWSDDPYLTKGRVG